MNTEFNNWWNEDLLLEDNPFVDGTPAFWAWEGWCAAVKAERKAIYDLVMEAPFKEFDRQEEDFDGEAANAMKAMAFSLTAAIRAMGHDAA